MYKGRPPACPTVRCSFAISQAPLLARLYPSAPTAQRRQGQCDWYIPGKNPRFGFQMLKQSVFVCFFLSLAGETQHVVTVVELILACEKH